MPVIKKTAKKTTAKSGSQKYTHYHKDGSIWAKGRTSVGKMEGYWVWFRKDGTKMRSGYFTKGKQTGKWTTYDKTGRAVKVTQM